ncbi:hypothetical protein ABT147_41750 [Streptomyces sp. NPDC001868]|uniref:hypothetical protein n=1 Tax=Streptomyces sp. NPDC001868 TaxID=3154401 RepID=UPI00332D05D1
MNTSKAATGANPSEERHGVRVGLGLRVRQLNRLVAILDTAEQLLVVCLDEGSEL